MGVGRAPHQRMSVAEGLLESESTVPGGCAQYVFTGCRHVPAEELEILYVEGSPTDDVPVEFLDADGEVHFPEIRIGEGGSLHAVLQNRWEDGNGGGGYYSLLHHAWVLQIDDTRGALQNLLAYIKGGYPLGKHWQRRELNRGMMFIVAYADESVPLIGQLREHFNHVFVVSDLGAESTVGVDCYCRTFANCRGVTPQSLTVNAQLSTLEQQLQFNGADGEVHVPHIIVGPWGALAAVVRNCWWNGWEGDEHEGGCYSLLWHTEVLTIRNNPGAVRDLAAYAAGEYKTNDPRWPAQPLDRGLRLSIEGVTDCEEEISALAEHFGVIRVDGRTVLNKRRQLMLDGCNGRERALRSLRPRVAGGTRTLCELTVALEEAAERAQKVRGRLAALWRRLDALAAAVQ